MDRPSTLFICFTVFVLHTKLTFTFDSIDEECRYEGSFNEKCFSVDKGYQGCKWNDEAYKYLVINITCTKPLSKCRCYEDYLHKQKCECIYRRDPPEFPAVGIIHWSGTAVVSQDYPGDEDEATKTYQYSGEVHKNSNGNFLLKKTNKHHMPFWRKLPEAKEEVEMVLRNGTTFTKYKGDEHSKVCRKYEVRDEASLTSIWTKHWNIFYKLDSEENIGNSKSKQVWKQFEQGEDYDTTWKWTVEYDSHKQSAIPLTYDYHLYDGFVGYTETIHYDYTFVPIGDGEETFQIEDFCTSFVPKKECDTKK